MIILIGKFHNGMSEPQKEGLPDPLYLAKILGLLETLLVEMLPVVTISMTFFKNSGSHGNAIQIMEIN